MILIWFLLALGIIQDFYGPVFCSLQTRVSLQFPPGLLLVFAEHFKNFKGDTLKAVVADLCPLSAATNAYLCPSGEVRAADALIFPFQQFALAFYKKRKTSAVKSV